LKGVLRALKKELSGFNLKEDKLSKPITIFTGQWADLPFEEICRKASSWGYDGLEIACWGDHMEVRKAAQDPAYVEKKKEILKKYNLKCWALGAHLAGQCVAGWICTGESQRKTRRAACLGSRRDESHS